MTNTSGIEPVDVRLLVQPDAPREQSKGGIFIPETTKEKEKFASVRATVIAVGENVGLDWGDAARKPAAGDRVLMAQYAGTNVKGDDDADYRIINDADVVGVLTGVANG
jgi:chaperonin GroES